MKAVRIEALGGPEVLKVVDVETPAPGPGEARVRHEAVGLNFIDTYRRTGLYPVSLPAVLGSEGAGVVDAVGPGVERVRVGQRVAYAGGLGSYAEAAVLPADRLAPLPDEISSRVAAAAMLKGLTAEFLTRIWPLERGDWVLVHAAAGGVGLLLTQWLSSLGVRVIGSVGTPEKAELARSRGCAEVVLYDQEDVAARVKALTAGAGARVVYDSVGRATFEASLKSLARRGLLVSYGNASGPAPEVAPLRLSQAGSVFLTRPTLFDYIATTEELDRACAALFDALRSGRLQVEIGQEWPLEAAAEAHRALEARRTRGSSLLIP